MPGSKLKVREVIDHSGQLFKSVCRHLGRCLTLLWKFACSRPGALESVSMEQLLGFVNDLSGQRVSTSAEWVELDLVEMFPNIPRDKILVAVKHFWSVLCKDKHLHPHSSGFRIHKPGVRPLDSISAGGASDSAYQFFPIHDILLLLSWDLQLNDRFVHFSSVFRQTTGTAIGGAISAQTSSLTLLYTESQLDVSALPPCFRYRDNYLMLHDPSPLSPFPAMSVERFQETMGNLLAMELTVEARGKSLGFLESQVTFYDGRPAIFVKEPVFVGRAGDPVPAAPKRWLDKHSPNVRSMLNSLVPKIAKKCAHYRSPHVPVAYALNVCNVAKVLLSKHYPISWWRPKLLKKAASWGLETEALSGIQLAGTPPYG